MDNLFLEEINDRLKAIDVLLTEQYENEIDTTLLPHIKEVQRNQILRRFRSPGILTDEEQEAATKRMAATMMSF